ncbi:MAG TPA: nucleotidyltransferase domain-containing protein [Acidiferrobacteraceae bacterium]|nr:nucleotidyltransferase domain-containing protein [Acidiferrobacteraceae bacterium]
MINDQYLIDRLRTALPNLLAIYRFGTWGTPNERPDSDIDLAILSVVRIDPVLCWDIAQELAALAHREVDLINLREASTVMRSQVIAHGQRLYCSDEEKCGEFEDMVFVAYAHLNEERREILKDARKRGSIYGG